MPKRRWKAVALLAAGIAIGLVVVGSPAGAHVGGTVNHLWGHLKPKADKRYLPGGTMPRGKTIRGTYWMGATAAAGFALATSEVSFGYKSFAAPPTAHFINEGTTPPAACPGSADNPRALPGHLCVYEDNAVNAGIRDTNGLGGDGTSYAFGARLFLRSAAAGDFRSEGTWAATSG